MLKHKFKAKKARSFWIDIKHNEDGSMQWGVETDDKEIAIDGHFVCLVPGPSCDESQQIAQGICNALNEKYRFGQIFKKTKP